MNDLGKLERLEKAATPVPWRTGPINYADIYGDGELILLAIKDRPRTVEDVQAIIALRNAYPSLLSVARAAKDYVDDSADDAPVTVAMERLRAELKAFEPNVLPKT
jgi:hypothetical protein